MFYIVAYVPPYVDVIQNANGGPMEFDTYDKAKEFARQSCIGEYRIVEF